MVRRRSTVRFRNGAPSPQFRGQFRSWNWPLPVSVQQLSAATTLPEPIAGAIAAAPFILAGAAVAALADHCEAHIRRYLARAKSRQRPSSYSQTERYLLTHWQSLHALPISKIERRAVAKSLSELTTTCGPAAADRARAVLSAFFAWAIREGLVEANPVIGTNRPYEAKGRERVLSATELAQVWKVAGEDRYGVVVKLLILTGQRREEIGGLRWHAQQGDLVETDQRADVEDHGAIAAAGEREADRVFGLIGLLVEEFVQGHFVAPDRASFGILHLAERSVERRLRNPIHEHGVALQAFSRGIRGTCRPSLLGPQAFRRSG